MSKSRVVVIECPSDMPLAKAGWIVDKAVPSRQSVIYVNAIKPFGREPEAVLSLFPTLPVKEYERWRVSRMRLPPNELVTQGWRIER